MRLLELCLSPDLGGLELYAYRCALELDKTDEVLGVIDPQGKLQGFFAEQGLAWVGLQSGFKPLPLITAKKLAKIIDQHRIDVLHVHWGKDLPLAAWARTLSRSKPRVVHTRQMQITRPKTDRYHRFIYKNMDLILAITQRLESDLKKFLPAQMENRIVTLYYGVKSPQTLIDPNTQQQLREELNVPEQAFLAGIFGRIKETKGQYLLIEAIKKLHSQGKTAYGLIVGHPMEPAYLEQLKQAVRESGLDPYIRFMDFVKEPQRWMQVCDTVILASQEETFGLVLAEAMQAGVAVIGTNSGGVPEIIEHGHSGLLFEPGDSGALAAQLASLQDDPQTRASLAQAGRERAAQLFDYAGHFRLLRQHMLDVQG
ncbi:glycosyltransferase family 4 protein [Thiohalophilus sp.]|uniref:glycosyltransferase family 4 protein n=1 Tax=Thiohalophilus sp. TaxID=3028392 RepID=UPI002ACEE98A|nr:glycosyltransferase family 4 protein [Thiohalophilus sp.]MDZ7661033.1 glycosyltransferase family 4 protein [Thiohalophilus sp.]